MPTDPKSNIAHPDDADTYDLGRYGSADGWEPPDHYKKLREKARREDTHIGPWNSMVEVRRADEVLSGARTPPSVSYVTPRDLFGPLFREGELAVLAAETGVGKSILATQIAATIAKGERFEPFRRPPRQPVLYIDLERSPAQFRERYSAPSANGKRRIKHHFGPNMQQVFIRDFREPPPAFKKDLDKYLLHSIRAAIAESQARVIIIDSLSYLAPTTTAATRLIKTLKLWTMHSNLSILAIASEHGRPPSGRGSLRPASLSTIHCSLSTIADSVFSLSRSSMSPDIRYIKHLKSTNLPATLDASSVATFRIQRLATETTESSKSSPPCLGGVAALRGRGGSSEEFPNSADSRLQTQDSRLTPPVSPFIGFQFLGLSSEQAHLIDYAAEWERAKRAQETGLKKLSTGSVVDMILSPEYHRYLKG